MVTEHLSQVPPDVDLRVMLTFLELYQTLLGFVHFKLYTDASLVYPPPLDAKKDDAAAGVGAFSLQTTVKQGQKPSETIKSVAVDGRTITGKDVRKTIKSIAAAGEQESGDSEMAEPDNVDEEEEAFVPQASHSQISSDLLTLQNLHSLPTSSSSNLFAPYTFWISREVPRSIFEFLIRSFGGRVGWPSSSGSGSPFDESDESITHVIIDRPPVEREETPAQRELRSRRKYVQPQWVVDSINASKILLEDTYAQGKALPPHLSPFGEFAGAYDPTAELEAGDDVDMSDVEEAEGNDVDEEEAGSDEEKAEQKGELDAALESVTEDPATLRAAELAAEAAGMDYGTFEAKVKKAGKKASSASAKVVEEAEKDMNKMMMSNKQRKLYEKMKYSQQKQVAEVRRLFWFDTEKCVPDNPCRKTNSSPGGARSRRRPRQIVDIYSLAHSCSILPCICSFRVCFHRSVNRKRAPISSSTIPECRHLTAPLHHDAGRTLGKRDWCTIDRLISLSLSFTSSRRLCRHRSALKLKADASSSNVAARRWLISSGTRPTGEFVLVTERQGPRTFSPSDNHPLHDSPIAFFLYQPPGYNTKVRR